MITDTQRLRWLLDNKATTETDGRGNWRVVCDWTNPPIYGPYAPGQIAAIDAVITAEKLEMD